MMTMMTMYVYLLLAVETQMTSLCTQNLACRRCEAAERLVWIKQAG